MPATRVRQIAYSVLSILPCGLRACYDFGMRSLSQSHDLRLAAMLYLLLFAGCQKPKPQLQYVRIGIAENNSPTVLGVELRNAGETDITFDGCSVQLQSTHLFGADGDTTPWPEKFEHHLELMETLEGRTVAPGETRVAGIAFVWDLPAIAPQLIAVCNASFSIRYGGSFKVESEEVLFVLASSEDARKTILGEPLSNVKDAASVASYFDEFEGKKSPDVEQVIKLLRELPKQ